MPQAALMTVVALALALSMFSRTSLAAADREAARKAVSAVIRLNAEIPADSRSAQTLGSQREGNGIVIDSGGLVLTIGYLIMEAMSVTVADADGKPIPAEIVAYDYDSGFGLVRALQPLGIEPVRLGASASVKPQDPVLVAGHGGIAGTIAAVIVDKREFAGYWEYMLDEAIFTAPPHADWGGAALLGLDGRLLGIGSLFVQNAAREDRPVPGNMFVPIDLLKPILADLLTQGRGAGPQRPWLGMYTQDGLGQPVVTHVAPGGPAEKAGVQPGDIVTRIGGAEISTVADLYRRLWSGRAAGDEIRLDVLRAGARQEIPVRSVNRYEYLRLQRSY